MHTFEKTTNTKRMGNTKKLKGKEEGDNIQYADLMHYRLVFQWIENLKRLLLLVAQKIKL